MQARYILIDDLAYLSDSVISAVLDFITYVKTIKQWNNYQKDTLPVKLSTEVDTTKVSVGRPSKPMNSKKDQKGKSVSKKVVRASKDRTYAEVVSKKWYPGISTRISKFKDH